MDIGPINQLNKDNLQGWLARPTLQEGWELEFKESLPDSRHRKSIDDLRDDFCSYANYRGGIFIYGIEDQTKRIVGIKESYDPFKRRIGDIIDSDISPLIDRWDVINPIRLDDGKYIYFVVIPESPYYLKPHIAKFTVHIRLNAKKYMISKGDEIRRLFMPERFYPESGDILLDIIERIKNSGDGTINYLDSIYLQRLHEYLKLRALASRIKTEFSLLVNLFEKVFHESCLRIKGAYSSAPKGEEREYVDTKIELNKLLDEFTGLYIKAHK
jgi:hypothetical protein